MGRKLTPEQREAKNAKQREKWKNATPEQREAKRESHRTWRKRPENKEYEKAYRESYLGKPEVREHNNTLQRERYGNRTEPQKQNTARYMRSYALRTKFDLTLEEWHALLESQGGRCAICRRSEPDNRRNWNTDHEPGTRRVRGILCNSCNTRLGKMGDRPFAIVLHTDALLRYLGVLGPDEHLTVAKFEVP